MSEVLKLMQDVKKRLLANLKELEVIKEKLEGGKVGEKP